MTLVQKVAFRGLTASNEWLFEVRFDSFSGQSFGGASRGLHLRYRALRSRASWRDLSSAASERLYTHWVALPPSEIGRTYGDLGAFDTFASIFSRIRTMGPDGGYPREVGGHRVASVRDVPLGLDTREADGRSRLPRVTDSFMVTLRFESGSTLTLRNSGTEPKLKFYFDVVGGGPAASPDGGEKARAAREEMKRSCLEELLEPTKNGLAAR